MPLRVSGNFDSTEVECKKVHKMSRRGHLQKVRRPTNLEVYNDAAKILEELLEKRIDDGVRTQNRQKRNKTDPTTERILESLNAPENPVARSKTMPSKYRESPNDEARKKELEAAILIKRDHDRIHEQAKNGFVSSADSEGEEENSMKKRKKKSLFKLAKERLIHTFNRDQKEGFGKMKKDIDDSPNHKRRKPKKKAEKEKVVSESSRHIKARLNQDNSVDYTEEVEYRNKSESIHTDVHCRNSRSSSFSRNSLINTIRRPFRKLDRQESNEARNSNCRVSKGIIKHQPSFPIPSTAQQSSDARPQELPVGDLPSPREAHASSSSKSPSPTKYDNQTVVDGIPHPLSSSSSVLPVSDQNSLGSLNLLPSTKSNILDSPGEDIEFMDIDMDQTRADGGDKHIRSIHASGIKFHTSEGLLNFNWLADHAASRAKTMDYEIDEHSVSRLRPDGDMEMTTTVMATRTVVMPEVKEVDENGSDHVDGDEEDKPMNKDELYGKIAQKLIAMADTYGGGMSDPEMMGATAASDAPLTDLEKEIIACLRSKDKYSKELEDKLIEATSSTVDDAYRRFHSTIQNSLGTELTWNHLAFVFYTTKGVVSALGKGSQAANQAKDFTLQYISDTFASWIMDQGGFDSMLSSSESDPEVD